MPDGRGLRERSARGTIINTVFLVLLNSLGLLRGFVVALFMTASDYGVWGILVVSVATLTGLKQIGVSDKYVQQAEEDQERAFQRALTVELLFTAVLASVILLAAPLIAVIYQRPELIAPGLVFAAILPANALMLPTWIFYRRMDFLRQRLLQVVEPIVGFVVTIGLAVAGAGYWSLVLGVLAGSWAGACAALIACPYPLRLRLERETVRRYWSFSWPVFVLVGSGLLIAQASTLIGNYAVGIAGVGALTLAARVSQYTDRVDGVITDTLYPAICAVRDRTELLFETFVKSNRLTLMWGFPFGVALSVFAGDLIAYGIGHRWDEAYPLFVAFGLTAAVNHIGFNWHAFFRARGDTRPLANVAAVTAAAFFLAPAPLMFLYGLEGLALGIGVMTLTGLAGRSYYLAKLFPGFRMVHHAARAIAPTVPAVLVVFLLRALESGPRTPALAAIEFGAYILTTAVATYLAERDLLREVAGYLRGRPATPRVAV